MRTLYLARHGEAAGPLTAAGREQAMLLGGRLAGVPVNEVFHSPVRRAAETAALVSDALPDVPVTVSPLVGDYLPYAPAARWLGINAANAALTVIQYRPCWPPPRCRPAGSAATR